MRDRERGVTTRSEDAQVELESNEEQIQDDAELGVDAEERGHAGWQQLRVERRSDGAKQRRAKKNAAEHLSNHAGLTDEAEEHTDETGLLMSSLEVVYLPGAGKPAERRGVSR